MPILDVSDWTVDLDKVTTGAREKVWLKKNKEYYLFKKPNVFGEIYAEYIAFLIGTDLFKLNIPEVKIARKNNVDGIISRNFIVQTDNSQYIESIDYFGPNFDKKDLYHYTVEDSLEIVKKFDLIDDFVNMCLFDFIIGNQDRHCENWGFLVSDQNKPSFAPLYDNGSSLFNGYEERRIKDMLTDEMQFVAYTNRATSIFTVNNERRPRFKKLLNYLLKTVGNYVRTSLTRYTNVTYANINSTIEHIDNYYISKKRKRLVAQLVDYRISLLSQWVLEEVKDDGSG